MYLFIHCYCLPFSYICGLFTPISTHGPHFLAKQINFTTYRTCSVYKTSGSCKYDNAVRSFCPIKMAGFRRYGKSLSALISIVRSSPASVTRRNRESFSIKSWVNVAPSQTVVGFGIQIRAPYMGKEKRTQRLIHMISFTYIDKGKQYPRHVLIQREGLSKIR